MSAYLLIDLLIIVIPLSLSFEGRIQFYRKFPAVFFSIVYVGLLFVFWDIIATQRGDWSFNPKFILGLTWLGIPVEELLFYFVVPYSCLFTYEVIVYFVQERTIPSMRFAVPILFCSFLLLGFWNLNRTYTGTVFLIAALVVLIANFLQPEVMKSKRYWLFLLVTSGAFLVVDAVLTSLPVLIYNDSANLGKRILTIPPEDFVFNFSLLTLYLLAYRFVDNKRVLCS